MRLSGLSYTQISLELKVPKSTLSYRLRDLSLTLEAKNKIRNTYSDGYKKGLLNRSVLQTKLALQRARDTRSLAQLDVDEINLSTLKFIGVALYWGEGYKKLAKVKGKERTSHAVSLTNSDPKLIKMFVTFLIRVCEVNPEKIKFGLRLFEHQDSVEILNFWIKELGLSATNFGKVYYGVSISSQRKKEFNSLKYGTLQVNVYNTQLFYRIMGWLDGIQAQLGTIQFPT